MKIQGIIKSRAKFEYFNYTGEHMFTTLGKMNDRAACFLSRRLYSKRIWEDYPVIESQDGNSFLFIHIPKCAGTSMANLFKKDRFHHFPAYTFLFSDEDRFRNIDSFSIIRNPLDRITSMLLHYSNSIYADSVMKTRAKMLGISEDNIYQKTWEFLSRKDFRKALFAGTGALRDGFSVQQFDFVTWKKTIIVDTYFHLTGLIYLKIGCRDSYV